MNKLFSPNLELIDFQVELIDDNSCKLSFILPQNFIPAFIGCFSSLSNLVKSVNWKLRINETLIHSRIEKSREESEKIAKLHEKNVCQIFLELVQNGESPRSAISITTSKVHELFPFSSYDQVKFLLTKNKLLKKSGFYKHRHKYDENISDIVSS